MNVLHTERLQLRQWGDSDCSRFAAMNADPRVMRFFPATLELDASNALAQRCRNNIARRGWGLWAVERKSDAEFLGFVGLEEPSAALPFAPCVEVGWRLGQEFWGFGYATEAAKAALRFGFETLDLHEIVSFTALTNTPSRAVMRRLGMHNSEQDFEHPNVPTGHPLRTHCLYRLSRQQWRELTLG
jgi:RimJ/RimL family protein N-acetyltransferase